MKVKLIETCLFTQVTDYNMAKNLTSYAVNGPTYYVSLGACLEGEQDALSPFLSPT